jgi:putative ABC transport system permease protein
MSPPKRIIGFLRWFCREDYIDEIEGDLIEIFRKELGNSPRQAKWKFAWRVMRYFRPEFIKPIRNQQPVISGMFSSYFKIGWRNLLRNKGYSVINIGGLAVGMMVAVLNGLWIWHELSYNKYYKNYDRIAQVAETGLDFERGGTWLGTTMTYPLGTELIEKYSRQFKRITRTSSQREQIMTVGEMKVTSTGLYADPSATEMLSLRMIRGSRGALAQTHSVVIAQSLATILFGTQDPLNKTILISNQSEVTVTGVFEDFPQNTEFNMVKFFVPWNLMLIENKWIEQKAMTDWRNHFIKIYVEIPEGSTFESVNDQVKSALQFDPLDLQKAAGRHQELKLYPMSNWHLHPPGLRAGQAEPVVMLKMVGAIGLFVLVLACINFVNLSTARAEKRSKEIGIRKTIGSVRGQLMTQFFSESFLVVAFASLLAIALTILVLPAFNLIATKNMTMPWGNIWFWVAFLCFTIFTSLLAGFYPAFLLSSFNPVKALKGKFRLGRMASLPRKVLVVFQFSISVILIIGTVVVYQQIQYAKNRPVGYDREGLIMIRKSTNAYKGKYETLRNELKNTGAVVEISESMGPVTEVYSGNNGWDWNGKDPNVDKSFATLAVSHLHGKTVGWQLIQGRDFDIANASDSSGLVINESALKFMDLKDPINEPVIWTWWADKNRFLDYKIIGVVKDMVMESPYTPAEPTMFYLKGMNGTPSWIMIRISPQISASEALPKIESVWRKVIPSVPFEYQFADEQYAQKFGKEERIGNLASIFAGLAVFISCLGLIGLTSFVTETRAKEIGIRKVLGASVAGLWKMLSAGFVSLVLIACVIAAPLANFLMGQWLNKFSYRIDVSIWVFIATALGALLVTLITISYQSIRTARMNPVSNLRTE